MFDTMKLTQKLENLRLENNIAGMSVGIREYPYQDRCIYGHMENCYPYILMTRRIEVVMPMNSDTTEVRYKVPEMIYAMLEQEN